MLILTCWWDQVWSLLLFFYLIFSVVKPPRQSQFYICDGQGWPLRRIYGSSYYSSIFFLKNMWERSRILFFLQAQKQVRLLCDKDKAISGSQEQSIVDNKVFPQTRKVSPSPVIIINNHKIVVWHKVLNYFQVQRPKPGLYWKHNQKHYSQPGRILQYESFGIQWKISLLPIWSIRKGNNFWHHHYWGTVFNEIHKITLK